MATGSSPPGFHASSSSSGPRPGAPAASRAAPPEGLSQANLLEVTWIPSSKLKSVGKGKVTARNIFAVPLNVMVLDHDQRRRINQRTLAAGEILDVARVEQGGPRFTFHGSDGNVLYLWAWPAEWDSGTWHEEWFLSLNRTTGVVTAKLSLSWEDTLGARRFESERLGVSVAYLRSFEEQARDATGESDPNFHMIAPRLAFGESALGKGKECPRDRRPDCSMVDALPERLRGRATHFLSWSWAYSLSTFVEAIHSWVKDAGLEPSAVLLWVCFFCNNQFRILEERSQEGSDNLEKSFAQRLTEIGRVVALFDSWQRPTYLERAWCVFEAFMAEKVAAHLTVILPPTQARSLESNIQSGGFHRVITAFRSVSIENAKATRAVDEERVKALILRTSSFDRVDRVVRDCLVAWCTSHFQEMVAGAVLRAESEPLRLAQDADEMTLLRAELCAKDAALHELEKERESYETLISQQRAELQAIRVAVGRAWNELVCSESDNPAVLRATEALTAIGANLPGVLASNVPPCDEPASGKMTRRPSETSV